MATRRFGDAASRKRRTTRVWTARDACGDPLCEPGLFVGMQTIGAALGTSLALVRALWWCHKLIKTKNL